MTRQPGGCRSRHTPAGFRPAGQLPHTPADSAYLCQAWRPPPLASTMHLALPPRIHPTATVEAGASIGHRTSIWHHAHVRTGAQVGSSCNLGKDVYVDEGAVIGDRVKIQNGVSVYRGVIIEDDVFVGPHAAFTNDLLPRAHSENWPVVETKVRCGASIGAHATIVCGIELGPNCMIGAGSVVTKTVQAHELVYGNPARHRGWVCRCGALISHSDMAPDSLACPDCASP